MFGENVFEKKNYCHKNLSCAPSLGYIRENEKKI